MGQKIRALSVSESAHGGLATYFNVLSGFRSPNLEVCFLIPDCHAYMLDAAVDHVTFRHTGRNPATIFRILRQFRAMVRSGAPDVIIFNSFFSIPALVVSRFLYPSVPRIYISHGWTILQFRRASAGRKMAELCERIACWAASCSISVSAAELTFARAHRLPGRHKLIIHAVPARAPDVAGSDERRDTENVNILYVGRLDHQKGVDLLLNAYAAACLVNPALRLTVIGEAARTRQNPFEQFAPLEALNVTFLGWLPRADIDGYYARADVLIVPSRWEAFGTVVNEAARLGTPSIVSDRGGLPELIRDEIDGHVFHLPEDEDIGPLTELLSRLSGPALRRMRQNVRAKMENKRSAGDMVAEFEQLIASLIDRDRPAIGSR